MSCLAYDLALETYSYIVKTKKYTFSLWSFDNAETNAIMFLLSLHTKAAELTPLAGQ